LLFSRTEGIIPAPESAHAIRVAIDEALEAKELGEERVIVFNLSGHGYFDLTAFQEYMKGDLQNYQHPQKAIDEALKKLPVVPVGFPVICFFVLGLLSVEMPRHSKLCLDNPLGNSINKTHHRQKI